MNSELPEKRGAPVGRRIFLGTLGLGALGVFAAPSLQRGMEALLGGAAEQDPTGLTGLLPNGGGFRYYSVTSSVPRKDAETYRLTVDGLVDHPATYTLADLRALPQTRMVRDVQCVTGWRVPGTPFEGVRLSRLLDAAGARSAAGAVRFTCFDGSYTESLTLEQARRADVLAALGSRALRADLALLNRFGPHDRRWLRAALRRDKRPASRPADKFNAGQKLYAAWVAGATLVMLGTGLMMWFTHLTPLPLRTGATFVHDWLALTLGVVLAGHIGMALDDPEARRGMRTGSVAREWALREHPLWRSEPKPPR